MRLWTAFLVLVSFCLGPVCFGSTVRSLDGMWELGESTDPDEVPPTFDHRVPVPGLADMAEPRLWEVGTPSKLRRFFWYRRTFRLDSVPESVLLKIHKACFGTRVYLNGELAGEHLPSFTPAYLDIRRFLKPGGEENELLIRLGAHRENLPPGMPTGWDFEKYRYIPGIYDSVEVLLSGMPRIVNLQVVPDVEQETARLVLEVENGPEATTTRISGAVREWKSGFEVGRLGIERLSLQPGERRTVELRVPVAGCRLWSPEDPFLYEAVVKTGADSEKHRFGMRSFRFDRGTGRALLNGRPYYMRGSNVTIYRFFEDAERGDRPWRAEWVRRLHRKFKDLNWNSLRYCIGFPPDFWYDIADEEGFLIQDEFPIWLLGNGPEPLESAKIIPEYVEWMRERWNHPSVVIWDGQNESHTPETGKAIQAVRHLDLSNRPWENGWAEPQSPDDVVEAHPYLFIRQWMGGEPFRISELASHRGVPPLQAAQKALPVPVIINEYGWLWLNRDGSPTTLTKEIYRDLTGEGATAEERRLLYARYLAALTEFWRAHRHAAGVLHFCGLGYSRPGDQPRPEGGATSDHFVDLETLELEPHFEEYLRNAFNPLGVMLDFWEESVVPGSEHEVLVFVVNDLQTSWRGTVTLRLSDGSLEQASWNLPLEVSGNGRGISRFRVKFPEVQGSFHLSAEVADSSGRTVQSRRHFTVR